MIWETIWDSSSNIAAFMAIIGPLMLVGWYFKAAKEKVRKLHER
mgnify:FL=1